MHRLDLFTELRTRLDAKQKIKRDKALKEKFATHFTNSKSNA